MYILSEIQNGGYQIDTFVCKYLYVVTTIYSHLLICLFFLTLLLSVCIYFYASYIYQGIKIYLKNINICFIYQ